MMLRKLVEALAGPLRRTMACDDTEVWDPLISDGEG